MNFNNINDFEFELLVKDILEKETGKRYRVFAPGRDNGIDVTSYEANDTFAQAKLYNKSSIATLISNLKNELPKVELINPKEYYIFTSRELSKDRVDELFDHFNKYMRSADNIYDGTRISDLLQCEEYAEILRKHYKLWLVSTEVLALTLNRSVFIDTDDLMYDINEDSKLYVKTSHHNSALSILQNENVLIIEGNPGVGKTLLSKMLLLDYASLDYRVKYASNNSIFDIKNSLSVNKDIKEIILLDDFLGQHYLDVTSTRTTELKSLIQLVIRSEHKKLILNSRVTILNEAQSKFQQFDTFIKDRNITKLMLSLTNISAFEKAMIFYNHLYFSSLPTVYFINICEHKRYINIVMHQNYNPRIIEYISKPYNYFEVECSKYYDYILDKLENPEDIWKDEFDNRIDFLDRILMLCLYSLTKHQVKLELLEVAYNHWISTLEVDLTKNNFEESIKRLNKSMIKISVNSNDRYVSVTNPSVNDFLYNRIFFNIPLLNTLLLNCYFYEQLMRLCDIYDKITSSNIIADFINLKIDNLSLLKMKTFDKNIMHYFILQIEKTMILDLKFKQLIHEAYYNSITYPSVSKSHEEYLFSNELFDLFISNREFCNFYSLYEILFDHNFVKIITKYISHYDINRLDAYLKENKEFFFSFYSNWDEYLDIYTCAVSKQLERIFDYLLWQEANDKVDDFVNQCTSEFSYSLEFKRTIKNKMVDWITERLYELNDENKDCLYYTEVEIDTMSIIYSLDFGDIVNRYEKAMYEDYKYDEWRDEHPSNTSSIDYSSEIKRMFDRSWDI